eukprot:m.146493 g.146493  ORF g.146493 m.146493 type:complete len:1054 (-) comp16242_c0_seq4:28-3189(-)
MASSISFSPMQSPRKLSRRYDALDEDSKDVLWWTEAVLAQQVTPSDVVRWLSMTKAAPGPYANTSQADFVASVTQSLFKLQELVNIQSVPASPAKSSQPKMAAPLLQAQSPSQSQPISSRKSPKKRLAFSTAAKGATPSSTTEHSSKAPPRTKTPTSDTSALEARFANGGAAPVSSQFDPSAFPTLQSAQSLPVSKRSAQRIPPATAPSTPFSAPSNPQTQAHTVVPRRRPPTIAPTPTPAPSTPLLPYSNTHWRAWVDVGDILGLVLKTRSTSEPRLVPAVLTLAEVLAVACARLPTGDAGPSCPLWSPPMMAVISMQCYSHLTELLDTLLPPLRAKLASTLQPPMGRWSATVGTLLPPLQAPEPGLDPQALEAVQQRWQLSHRPPQPLISPQQHLNHETHRQIDKWQDQLRPLYHTYRELESSFSTLSSNKRPLRKWRARYAQGSSWPLDAWCHSVASVFEAAAPQWYYAAAMAMVNMMLRCELLVDPQRQDQAFAVQQARLDTAKLQLIFKYSRAILEVVPHVELVLGLREALHAQLLHVSRQAWLDGCLRPNLTVLAACGKLLGYTCYHRAGQSVVHEFWRDPLELLAQLEEHAARGSLLTALPWMLPACQLVLTNHSLGRTEYATKLLAGLQQVQQHFFFQGCQHHSRPQLFGGLLVEDVLSSVSPGLLSDPNLRSWPFASEGFDYQLTSLPSLQASAPVLWQRDSHLGLRLKASWELITQAGDRRINPRKVEVKTGNEHRSDRSSPKRLPSLPDTFGLPRLGEYISMLTNAAAMRVVRRVLEDTELWNSLPFKLQGVSAADRKTRVTQARQAACAEVNTHLETTLETVALELQQALATANQSYGIAQEEALAEQTQTELDNLHKLVQVKGRPHLNKQVGRRLGLALEAEQELSLPQPVPLASEEVVRTLQHTLSLAAPPTPESLAMLEQLASTPTLLARLEVERLVLLASFAHALPELGRCLATLHQQLKDAVFWRHVLSIVMETQPDQEGRDCFMTNLTSVDVMVDVFDHVLDLIQRRSECPDSHCSSVVCLQRELRRTHDLTGTL